MKFPPPLACALLACCYALAHLIWYLDTPLGREPVLDEREMVDLAVAIAQGTLPAEPFLRAMGYPLALAGLVQLGVAPAELFRVGLLLGVVLHSVSAGFMAACADRLIAHRAAPWIAGLAGALHPVFVHYATQLLDAAWSQAWFLAGLWLVVPRFQGVPLRLPAWLGLGVCWSVAALSRPQLQLLWLLLAALVVSELWRRRPLALAAFAPVVGLLLAQGLWAQHIAGAFRLSPWQGPYNLWAANRPGAHGRYLAQQRFFTGDAATHRNPAEREARELYAAETGLPATDPVDAINAHWRARLRAHVLAHPVDWAALVARKAVLLLSDWEHYNNKTYAFHRSRSPWLRWNPLGFGLLLLAGTLGAAALATTQPRPVAWLAALAVLLAGPLLLTLVSARFRLPLAAVAGLGAGGLALLPAAWRSWALRRRLAHALGLGLLGAVSYSGAFGARDRATFLQDHLLLAGAAHRSGDDHAAWAAAGDALALAPARTDALGWRLTSYFNLLLAGDAPPADERTWQAAALAWLAGDGLALDPATGPIAGLALWRAGQADAARALWAQLANQGTPAAAEAAAALALAAPATSGSAAPIAPASRLGAPRGPFTQILAGSAAGDTSMRALAADLFRSAGP